MKSVSPCMIVVHSGLMFLSLHLRKSGISLMVVMSVGLSMFASIINQSSVFV